MSGLRIGSLFSGYGGLEQGVQSVLGGTVAWHSDIDPGACKILAHRYPDVPNLGDITAVDWSAVGAVDVLTGGFPCQDVSSAGLRKGLRPDTRSGLWTQMAYAIDQLRPSLVVIENVRGLLSAEAHSDLEPCPWCVGDGGGIPLRALGAVLGGLADIGYDASWQGLRAADVGAPHGRFRVFVTAWPNPDAVVIGRRPAWWDYRVRAEGLVAEPAADAGGFGRDRREGDHGTRRPAPLGSETGDHAGDPAGPSSDADRTGLEGGEPARGRLLSDRGAAANAARYGRHQGWPESARVLGGSDAAVGGAPAAADTDGAGSEARFGRSGTGDSRRREPLVDSGTAWGQYEPAVRRWEQLTRPAPSPVEAGKNGQPRLSPAFVEWMQGLPAGWVTDVPALSRNEQLKALGNGVVPQQAAQALRLLLPDVARAAA